MAKPPEKTPTSDEPESPTEEIVKKLTPLLRPERRQEAERVIGMVLQKSHSGPLPAPEDLADYERICPGAADRIITMAESNMNHRQSMEKTLVKSEYGLRTRGQWLALAALVVMLAVIAFTFWLGQPIAGSVLGSATLIAVTGMFLGRDKNGEEDEPSRPQPKGGKKSSRRR